MRASTGAPDGAGGGDSESAPGEILYFSCILSPGFENKDDSFLRNVNFQPSGRGSFDLSDIPLGTGLL